MLERSWLPSSEQRSCAPTWGCAEDREDHAACIGHWLSVPKDDKRAIFVAAARAQRAAAYLSRFSATEAAAA